jgi:hypothetical protein
MRPIFRWTIGGTTNIGYDCLDYSITSVFKLYGDTFDYYILYNNSNVQMLREVVGHRAVTLISQSWEDSPIPIPEYLNSGSSLWKFCPARLNINCHEIVSDNDVVIVNKVKQIDEFLSRSDSMILVEDPIKFQGNFRHLFSDVNYNAGFVGLPPGYDLGNEMKIIWEENGRPKVVGRSDEQGLTTAAMKKGNFLFISKKQFTLVHPQGGTLYSIYDEQKNSSDFGFYKINFFYDGSDAYHFVGINRNERHDHWDMFKKQLKQKLGL